MNFEESFNVIRSRFQSLVVEVIEGGLPTQYDNAPFVKSQDGPWARFTIKIENSTQAEFGAPTRRYRSFGTAVASVHTPINQGDKEVLTLADMIAGVFRGVSDSGVTFLTPTIVNLGRSADEWQVNVNCPFYVDDVI